MAEELDFDIVLSSIISGHGYEVDGRPGVISDHSKGKGGDSYIDPKDPESKRKAIEILTYFNQNRNRFAFRQIMVSPELLKDAGIQPDGLFSGVSGHDAHIHFAVQ